MMPLSVHTLSTAAVIAVIATLLSACQPNSPEDMLEDYHQRVANTLDTELETEISKPALLPLPQRRDRRAATEELRAGLLESIEFKQCDLLPLIAERNSSLGKVMQPSKLMSYELRFFARLEPCYQKLKLETDSDFNELLLETYRVKSANLEAVVWNGIITSEEIENNFSLSRDPIPLAGNPGFGDALRALDALNDIVTRVERYRQGEAFSLPPALANLEDHYFSLYASEFGSQLIQSLALLTQQLNKTAALLEQAIAKRPLCFNKKTNSKADILQNVFFKYYAGQVQPYMAQVQRQGEQWLSAVDKFLSAPGLPVPTVMNDYHQQMLAPGSTTGLWQQYQQALQRHTQAWQTVLGQCGMMPSG